MITLLVIGLQARNKVFGRLCSSRRFRPIVYDHLLHRIRESTECASRSRLLALTEYQFIKPPFMMSTTPSIISPSPSAHVDVSRVLTVKSLKFRCAGHKFSAFEISASFDNSGTPYRSFEWFQKRESQALQVYSTVQIPRRSLPAQL